MSEPREDALNAALAYTTATRSAEAARGFGRRYETVLLEGIESTGYVLAERSRQPAPDLRAAVLAAFDSHRDAHGESCDCDLGIALGELAALAVSSAPSPTRNNGPWYRGPSEGLDAGRLNEAFANVVTEPAEARDLTAEEEQAIRDALASTGDEPWLPHTATVYRWVVGSLATIDALRAEAARPSEGLRKEAIEVVEHWGGEHIEGRTCAMQDHIDDVAGLIGLPRAWPAEVRAPLDQPRSGEAARPEEAL